MYSPLRMIRRQDLFDRQDVVGPRRFVGVVGTVTAGPRRLTPSRVRTIR